MLCINSGISVELNQKKNKKHNSHKNQKSTHLRGAGRNKDAFSSSYDDSILLGVLNVSPQQPLGKLGRTKPLRCARFFGSTHFAL